MPLRSPTAEGFRVAFRRPSLTLAEISWRWSAGATAAALLSFGLFEYLDTLPVTNGELLFLRTRHPYLVGEAIAHILRGSLNRVVLAGMVVAFLLSLLWIVAASVGRIATVRGLLDYFRGSASDISVVAEDQRDGAGDFSANEFRSSPWRALARLNFLRVAVALAALLGFAGASILAGFASPEADPQPGLAFLLFLPLASLVCLVWWAMNWLLSLAGVFAVRDGEDAAGAISAAVALCRERTGAVFAVSSWMGLAHLVAFVGASVLVSIPLGFATLVSWRLVLVGMMLVTLAYFALADWLYLARLAGYVCIAEMPEEMPVPPPPLSAPPSGGLQIASGPIATGPISTTIDRDEPILSDVPFPAVTT